VEPIDSGLDVIEGSAQQAVAFFEALDFGAPAVKLFGGQFEFALQSIALIDEHFVGRDDETALMAFARPCEG